MGTEEMTACQGVVGGWQISEFWLYTPQPLQRLSRLLRNIWDVGKQAWGLCQRCYTTCLPLLLRFHFWIGKTVFGWDFPHLQPGDRRSLFVWLSCLWIEQSKWQKMSWTSLGAIYIYIYIYIYLPFLIIVNNFKECYKMMWLLKEMLFYPFSFWPRFWEKKTINSWQ